MSHHRSSFTRSTIHLLVISKPFERTRTERPLTLTLSPSEGEKAGRGETARLVVNLFLSSFTFAIACAWPFAFGAENANQTEPKVIDPGSPGGLPSDAIVLFDGKDLSKWESVRGGDAQWPIADGAMTVKGGSIRTKEEFGDVQLHVEWATPAEVKGEGQGRGNSGVYLQGRYEIQVLDSYNNKTYPNGQAGAFYGHSAPLVNASRKPGEWQSFDIIFRAPKTSADGKEVAGSLTVLHNGVLVQDHVPVKGGPTTAAEFKGPGAKGPVILQDHGNPVRYRNIWIRPI